MSLWLVSEGVPPLTGDGSQFDARPDHLGSESPLDLPLQDGQPAVAAPALFKMPEEPRSSGRVVAIAGALVIGLLTGFTGGFLVGQRGAALPPPRAAAAVPAPLDAARGALSDSRRAPAPQTHTDAAVDEATQRPEIEVARPEPPDPPPPSGSGAPNKVRATGEADDPGALQFASHPAGASVYVDGALAGKTPLTMADVEPGTHRVRLELPGHRTWATSVAVEAGARVRVGASLER